MEKLNWIYKDEKYFNTIPEGYGVYLVIVHCENNRDIVVYTGQSNNLQDRIKQHWSPSETNKELKNAISKYRSAFGIYYAVADGRKVDGIECYLFKHYNPQLGDRAPNSTPIEVNLPYGVSIGHVNF